jgi:hypothetical protein
MTDRTKLLSGACEHCKHWQKFDDQYELAGKCDVLRIDTLEDFVCAYYEQKSVRHEGLLAEAKLQQEALKPYMGVSDELEGKSQEHNA